MVIKAKKVLVNGKILTNRFIEVNNDKIASITKTKKDYNLEADIVSPGFIDNHCHGAGGYDFMDANYKAYSTILKTIAKGGTTSVLATSITSTQNKIKKMLVFASSYQNKEGQAQIIGLHAEGPFISIKKKGAHNEDDIHYPCHKLTRIFLKDSNSKLKVITYAPEEDWMFHFTKFCKKKGIYPQIGHTVASEKIVKASIKAGAKGITHAYNGMPKDLESETTGFLAASNLYGEIISDGIHNTNKQVKDFVKKKGFKKTILITDSIRAAGQKDGTYKLGTIDIIKKGLKSTLKGTNNIAGSAVFMIDVVKNTNHNVKIPLDKTLMMASENVARYHKLKDRGFIKKGYRADLVLLDKDLNITKVIIGGKVIK